jgi:hypothetical protein
MYWHTIPARGTGEQVSWLVTLNTDSDIRGGFIERGEYCTALHVVGHRMQASAKTQYREGLTTL